MSNKINEDFSNVFDSSLVDYSDDFKNQDKEYHLKQIDEWLYKHVWNAALRDLSPEERKKYSASLYKVAGEESGVPIIKFIGKDKNDDLYMQFSSRDENPSTIPFKIAFDDTYDRAYIGLSASGRYRAEDGIFYINDLKFLSEINQPIQLHLYDVNIKDLSYVPKTVICDTRDVTESNIFSIENLKYWKNTNFIFKDDNKSFVARHEQSSNGWWNGQEYKYGEVGGVLNVITDVKGANYTYEQVFKSILENIHSSVIDNNKHLTILFDWNNRKDTTSFRPMCNLFKVDDVPVLICYNNNIKSRWIGGTWDGHTEYWASDLAFILDNGRIKEVKVDLKENKISYDVESNPLLRMLGESFESVFDSDLVDYSADFEKQDKKQQILNWLHDNVDWYEVISTDAYDKMIKQGIDPESDNETCIQWALNHFVTINEDWTIDFKSDRGMNCNIQFKIDSENNKNVDIPPFIKFHEIWNGIYMNVSTKSLNEIDRWFPTVISNGWGSSNETYKLWMPSIESLKAEKDFDYKKFIYTLKNILEKSDIYKIWLIFDMDSLKRKQGSAYIWKDISYWYDSLDWKCPEFNKDFKIDESFTDVFDSSLTDYSGDFEEQDKSHIKEMYKNKIDVWMSLYTMTTEHYKHNSNSAKVRYTLEDDPSNPNGYLINAIDGCFVWDKGEERPDASVPILDETGNIPEFIKFNKCDGDFIVALSSMYINFDESTVFNLKFAPRIVRGNFCISHNGFDFNVDPTDGPETVWNNYECLSNHIDVNKIKTNYSGLLLVAMPNQDKAELDSNGYLFGEYSGLDEENSDGYCLVYDRFKNQNILCDIGEIGPDGIGIYDADSDYDYYRWDTMIGLDRNLEKGGIYPDRLSDTGDLSPETIDLVLKYFAKKNAGLITESFDTVFDSDLTDYSKDYEKADKQYKEDLRKKPIYDWIKATHTADLENLAYDPETIPILTVNDDLTIDVSGDLDCDAYYIKDVGIPKYIQFRNVYGSFSIEFLDNIYNLTLNPGANKRGALGFGPKYVSGDYKVSYCGGEKCLIDLKGCPETVGGNFNCMHNNIKTFKYFPKHVGGNFICYGNGIELWDTVCYDGRPGEGWTPNKVKKTFKIDGNVIGDSWRDFKDDN